MKEAIATIGRGEACFEGTPFTLESLRNRHARERGHPDLKLGL